MEDAVYLSDTIKEAIGQLIDECANFGPYILEVTKKNCAVDDAGHLILLDAVFDLSEVRAQWRKHA